MKIIVDLINKSLKVLENEKNIYVGNNNADVLKLYCYNGGYHLENEFVSITGLLSNGRKIGPFTTDSAYDEEYIDGKLHTLAKFTLTKQNGFTLSEGQLNITIWHNKTNDSGAIVSKQAIGNLVFNVVKTANVDDNIIITDASGDVIYNFKLEIENIQSAVNSVNSSFVKFKQHTEDSLMRLEDNKADLEVMWDAFDNYSEQIPYGDRKYHYSFNLTADNTVRELIDELKSDEMFDENNEGKFYIKLSDDTVLENIHIKLKYLTKPERKTVYYINSIIREKNNIKIYIATLNDSSVLTITELIAQHQQIATKQDIADLINSAPETLDTLGELAAALEDNKEVVEVLNEAIGNKADISYVDEKVANAGVPTDLLERVETLETLSEEAVYMEDTEFDVEEETGGSVGGGKEIVILDVNQFGIANEDSEVIDYPFYTLDLSNKYTVLDLTGLSDSVNVTWHVMDFDFYTNKPQFKNATILIKMRSYNTMDYMFSINSTAKFEVDPCLLDNDFLANLNSYENYADDTNSFFIDYTYGYNHFIKIEFDENGLATWTIIVTNTI